MKTFMQRILVALISLGLVAAPVALIPAYALAQAPTPTKASKAEQKLASDRDKGIAEIDKRIDSLTKLAARVNDMRNLSTSQKTSIQSTIQAEIVSLTGLKNKITIDTATTTVRDDLKSITSGHRVYALIMPQIQLIAAGDRATTVIGKLNTIGSKLQARIASDPSAATSTTVQTKMTDLASKLADAQSQVQAAINEVTPLSPDNGDKTKFAANQTALKDARSKIQKAEQDIVAARKDAEAVVNTLMKERKGVMKDVNASSTSSSTSRGDH